MNDAAIIGQLAKLAGGHSPHDEHERRQTESILDWLPEARSPLDREQYEPGHATGSGFVVSDAGRVALIFHKLGRWVQPGGHAEAHEFDITEVAARESSEELGLAITTNTTDFFDLDVHDIPPRGDQPRHLHFDFRFLAVIPERELQPASDAEHAAWLTMPELAELPLDTGLRRMVEKAAARGLLR